ncbi:PIN domain-containing protein [Candidatus Magnetomoraceae bacterium gMMP-15]
MILLDTHAWWWAISEPENLSAPAQQLISDTPSGQHCISSISLWEFAMMAQRGRIQLTITPQEWLSFALGMANTQVLPLSADIALDSCNLPGEFHKDPADRLIVATARISHLTLVTKDRKIRDYKHVKTI